MAVSTYNAIFESPSFTDMIAPMLMYQQMYERQSDEFDKLSIEAAKWEKLADSAIDQEQYIQYKQYADGLKQAADRIAQSGIDRQSAYDLKNYKRMYNEIILPINEAYDIRNQRYKEWRDAITKDPSLRTQRSPAEIGLGEYIKNPNTSWGEQVSGNNVMAETVALTKSIVQNAISSGKLESIGIPYQYRQKITQEGLPVEEVLNWMANDPTIGQQALQKVAKIIKDQYKDITDPALQQYVDDKINEGIIAAAVGKASYTNVTDSLGQWKEQQAISFQYDLAKQQAAHRLEHPEMYDANGNYVGATTNGEYDLKPFDLRVFNNKYAPNKESVVRGIIAEKVFGPEYGNYQLENIFKRAYTTRGNNNVRISYSDAVNTRNTVSGILKILRSKENSNAKKILQRTNWYSLTEKDLKTIHDAIYSEGSSNTKYRDTGVIMQILSTVRSQYKPGKLTNQDAIKSLSNIYNNLNPKTEQGKAYGAQIVLGNILNDPRYKGINGKAFDPYNPAPENYDTLVNTYFGFGNISSENKKTVKDKLNNNTQVLMFDDNGDQKLVSFKEEFGDISKLKDKNININDVVYFDGSPYISASVNGTNVLLKPDVISKTSQDNYGYFKTKIDEMIKIIQSPRSSNIEKQNAMQFLSNIKTNIKNQLTSDFGATEIKKKDVEQVNI